MSKFEGFLKSILIAVFKYSPYDKEKAVMSFNKIKKAHVRNKNKGEK